MQHLDRALSKDSRADTLQSIVTILVLNDDLGNAGLVEQGSEQQAGGACADDGYLGAHGFKFLKG